MKESIRGRARELGFDDCRFTTAAPPESGPEFERWLEKGLHGQMQYLERGAAKRLDLERVLPGAKSVITLATSYYHDEEREAGSKQGLVARYARYADYHNVIGKRLTELADFIRILATPLAPCLWYVDTGPILERDLAQRAGLGFIGKHTNVISRKLGNWIFLSEIITTLELEPDAAETNRCGSCTRCIAACPTAAIQGPFRLDARLCISYLTIELKGPIPVELRPAIGNRIFGCDDCLEACPWNRFAKEGRLMADHARHELTTPDLVELLGLNHAQFKKQFEATPMMRAKRSGLVRNVCVALGNVGDQAALPALEKAAGETDSLIAEHARWAMQQIEQRTGCSRGR